jgi:hypothetical protein
MPQRPLLEEAKQGAGTQGKFGCPTQLLIVPPFIRLAVWIIYFKGEDFYHG